MPRSAGQFAALGPPLDGAAQVRVLAYAHARAFVCARARTRVCELHNLRMLHRSGVSANSRAHASLVHDKRGGVVLAGLDDALACRDDLDAVAKAAAQEDAAAARREAAAAQATSSKLRNISER